MRFVLDQLAVKEKADPVSRIGLENMDTRIKSAHDGF
jgi:hypothetical protein